MQMDKASREARSSRARPLWSGGNGKRESRIVVLKRCLARWLCQGHLVYYYILEMSLAYFMLQFEHT